MNAGNRFLLVIYALVTTLLAGSAMLWLADFSWFSDLCLKISQQAFFWQVVWVLLIIYVLGGLHFIWAAFSGWEENHLLISNQEFGKVTIVTEAVEDFTQKILLHHQDIKEASSKLKVKSGAIQLQIKITVTPEVAIPGFSSELQEEVKSKIQHTIGLEIQTVEILVQKISPEAILQIVQGRSGK